MDTPQFAYPFTSWWTLGLFPCVWPLRTMLLCTFACKSFCGCMFSFFLSRYEWIIGAALGFEGWKGKDGWRHSTKNGGLASWDSIVREGTGLSLSFEVRPKFKSVLCHLLVLWLLVKLLTSPASVSSSTNTDSNTYLAGWCQDQKRQLLSKCPARSCVHARGAELAAQASHCTHIPKGPWAPAGISRAAVACHMAHWDRAWHVCPSSSQSHAGQTSQVPLLSSHGGWARASVSSLHLQPMWQHGPYGYNVVSWLQANRPIEGV